MEDSHNLTGIQTWISQVLVRYVTPPHHFRLKLMYSNGIEILAHASGLILFTSTLTPSISFIYALIFRFSCVISHPLSVYTFVSSSTPVFH
jgi:hypothetical protein